MATVKTLFTAYLRNSRIAYTPSKETIFLSSGSLFFNDTDDTITFRVTGYGAISATIPYSAADTILRKFNAFVATAYSWQTNNSVSCSIRETVVSSSIRNINHPQHKNNAVL